MHADLRFARTDATSTAWAYLPWSFAYGGDSWYRASGGWYNTPIKGNYAAHTFLHELGHAMGVLHGHDTSNPFGAVPAAHDSLEYTVMTYRSYVGAPLSGYVYDIWSAPQTLLERHRGAAVSLWRELRLAERQHGLHLEFDHRRDVHQRRRPRRARRQKDLHDRVGRRRQRYLRFFQLSSNLSINLEPGKWTTTSSTQLANLGNGHIAAGNIANALLYNNNTASLIESAIGGSGNDTITGNAAVNTLQGGGGADTLNGMQGADILTGGLGADAFVFDGTAYSDALNSIIDRITDYNFAAGDKINLSSLISTNSANLPSFVSVVASSGNSSVLLVDLDGTASSYGWTAIARIDGLGLNDDVSLLIGPSATVMNTKVVSSVGAGPTHSVTYYDTANQYGWSSYSATYNYANQLMSVAFNYDDGTHSAVIYDAMNIEQFSDYLVTYNAAWQVPRIIFNYDDGSHTVASYDMANEYSYTDYLATFDSQWNLTRAIFVNDNGTNSVRFYDVQNQSPWAWKQTNYDSSWNKINEIGANDDGSTFSNASPPPVGAGNEIVPTEAEHDDGHDHGAEVDEFPAWIGNSDPVLVSAADRTFDDYVTSLIDDVRARPPDWLLS